MATNVYFIFSDSCSNPIIGAKVALRPYAPPYVSGSILTQGAPVSAYTSNTGYVEFDSVVPGIYSIVVGNSYDNAPSEMINNPSTLFYVNLPETSGSLITGSNYIV